MRKAIFWIVAILGVGFFALRSMEAPKFATAKQTTLASIVARYAAAYSDASGNEFAEREARSHRAAELCAAFPDRTFSDFDVSVISISATAGDRAAVSVGFSPVTLRTYSSAIQDSIGKTPSLVQPTDRFYTFLVSSHARDRVRVSGSFFSSDSDCLREGSITESGGMSEPEFMVRFSDVSRN